MHSSGKCHDMLAKDGPATFASVASASTWTPTRTTSPVLPSRSDDGKASNRPGVNSTTRPATTINVLHLQFGVAVQARTQQQRRQQDGISDDEQRR